MLSAKKDLYNGLIIDTKSIPSLVSDFQTSLQNLLQEAQKDNISLLWLDLTTNQHEHLSFALSLGFKFHNCEATRTTLTYSVQKEAYIPVPPTHTIGVGAVVINKNNEILLVQDRIHTSHSIYKLPGGMLEEAQSLEDGVVREVWEETGIRAKLIKMVSVLNSHPYRFNKSNMYIVFQLEALSSEINIIDTNEIEKAFWMPLEDFYAHKEMSTFQKDLVSSALNHEGLTLSSNDVYFPKKKHVEVYR